jgi:hypothetical protein
MDSCEIVFLLLVLLIGFFLIVVPSLKEGFQAGMPGVRCGVDLPTCDLGLQCINGFCNTAKQPELLPNELPVYP